MVDRDPPLEGGAATARSARNVHLPMLASPLLERGGVRLGRYHLCVRGLPTHTYRGGWGKFFRDESHEFWGSI